MAAKEHSLPRAGKKQPLLCARYRDVAKSALFLHLVGFADGLYAGENALLAADDKDVREFQSLCRMHGHHNDAVGAVIVVVHICIQGNVGKVAFESGIIRLTFIVNDARFQLFYVLSARIVLYGVLFFKHAQISGALNKLIVQKVRASSSF